MTVVVPLILSVSKGERKLKKALKQHRQVTWVQGDALVGYNADAKYNTRGYL